MPCAMAEWSRCISETTKTVSTADHGTGRDREAAAVAVIVIVIDIAAAVAVPHAAAALPLHHAESPT